MSLCIAWGGSKFKTIEDAIAQQMVVAGTGVGSSTDIYPVVLNEVLGTKFKVITGYQGSQETIIAIERGEVDGRCGWGWSSLKSTKPDWVRDKKVNYLLQLALEKNPNIDAPLVMDLVKDAGRPADADAAVRPAVAQQAVLRPARHAGGTHGGAAQGASRRRSTTPSCAPRW